MKSLIQAVVVAAALAAPVAVFAQSNRLSPVRRYAPNWSSSKRLATTRRR